jgi:uncharacterized protein YjbI with pentapeptide repeats
MNITLDIRDYSDQVFKDESLGQEEIDSKEFFDCEFVACSFAETVFRNCRFVACAFRNCDLSLVRVPDCSFTNTRFEDCKVIGVDWTEAAWPKGKIVHPISFSKCVLNHATFIGLNLPQLKLLECIAHEVDFREADLSQADFAHTDLSGSLFINTNLTRADFTHSRNYIINAGLNTLKKTKFSLPEAMSLLHSLDIVLAE